MQEGERAESAKRLTFTSVRLALTPTVQGQAIKRVIADVETVRETHSFHQQETFSEHGGFCQCIKKGHFYYLRR